MAVQEINTIERQLTNYQRVIDREIGRAHESNYDILRLPTRSRRRRANTTIKQLIKQNEDTTNGNTDSMPVPLSPSAAPASH
jgi:hypothetical protein